MSDEITVSKGELSRRLRLLADEYELTNGRPLIWPIVDEAVRARGAELSRSKWFYMLGGDHVLASNIDTFEALGAFFEVPAEYLYTEDTAVPQRLLTSMPDILRLRANRISVQLRSVGELAPTARARIDQILADLEVEDGEEGGDDEHS